VHHPARLGDAQRALAHLLQRAAALEPANGKHAEVAPRAPPSLHRWAIK